MLQAGPTERWLTCLQRRGARFREVWPASLRTAQRVLRFRENLSLLKRCLDESCRMDGEEGWSACVWVEGNKGACVWDVEKKQVGIWLTIPWQT